MVSSAREKEEKNVTAIIKKISKFGEKDQLLLCGGDVCQNAGVERKYDQ